MKYDKVYTTPLNLRWPRDKEKILAEQARLSRRLSIAPLKRTPQYVAGVDAAFLGDKVIAAVSVYIYETGELVEEAYSVKEITFPNLPGFLAFREGPAIIGAVERLKVMPDVIIFDGPGIAHPKGFGLASYVGLLLMIPSIGCAKTRLVGTNKEPGARQGSHSVLKYEGETVGSVVRTREGASPVFVSPGNLIDIKESVDVVLKCTGKYRITEPVRSADALTRKLKKAFEGDRSLGNA
jgi:deoxyribonuclease V